MRPSLRCWWTPPAPSESSEVPWAGTEKHL